MLRKRKAPHLATGEYGERLARIYLLFRGYRILERNYVCPQGEIDIVALKKGVIVFVEVRTRQPGALVDPFASITNLKLAHFMDAARYFLTVNKKAGTRFRFDLISVRTGGPLSGRIRHCKDAFYFNDERPMRGRKLKAWLSMRPRP